MHVKGPQVILDLPIELLILKLSIEIRTKKLCS